VRDALLVGAGGFLGSMARFLLGGWVHRRLPALAFPAGTLAVNLVGCLMIGLIGGLAESRGVLGARARLFLLLGLLGGFTTFSSFAWETLALARDGELAYLAANVVISVVGGLAAAWAGLALGRM
jgi:fluoride exporter